MRPLGWPGSMLFLVDILTVSSGESDIAVQDWPLEVLMFTQNVLIILCASFIMFLLASWLGITVEIPLKIIRINMRSNIQSYYCYISLWCWYNRCNTKWRMIAQTSLSYSIIGKYNHILSYNRIIIYCQVIVSLHFRYKEY